MQLETKNRKKERKKKANQEKKLRHGIDMFYSCPPQYVRHGVLSSILILFLLFLLFLHLFLFSNSLIIS